VLGARRAGDGRSADGDITPLMSKALTRLRLNKRTKLIRSIIGVVISCRWTEKAKKVGE
jgi:hypothetical protein